MLRWTVSLAVLVAMMVSSTELMAQRRQPLRNLARQIGVRWSPGIHWQSPGHDSSNYSAWSDHNTPNQNWQNADGHMNDGQWIQGEGEIIQSPGATIQAAPAQVNPQPSKEQGEQGENSATRLLHQPGDQANWNTRPQNTSFGISPNAIQQGNQFKATAQDNLQINRYLKPYHQSAPTTTPIKVPNGGGQFQIAPSQLPNENVNWNTRTNQFQPRQTYSTGGK